jgi:hypothetical protein
MCWGASAGLCIQGSMHIGWQRRWRSRARRGGRVLCAAGIVFHVLVLGLFVLRRVEKLEHHRREVVLVMGVGVGVGGGGLAGAACRSHFSEKKKRARQLGLLGYFPRSNPDTSIHEHDPLVHRHAWKCFEERIGLLCRGKQGGNQPKIQFSNFDKSGFSNLEKRTTVQLYARKKGSAHSQSQSACKNLSFSLCVCVCVCVATAYVSQHLKAHAPGRSWKQSPPSHQKRHVS